MEWDLAKSGRRVKTDDVEEDKELKWERNSVSLGKSAQIYQAAFFAAPQARRGIRKTPFIGDRKSSLRLFGKREFLDTLVFPNGETPVLAEKSVFLLYHRPRLCPSVQFPEQGGKPVRNDLRHGINEIEPRGIQKPVIHHRLFRDDAHDGNVADTA